MKKNIHLLLMTIATIFAASCSSGGDVFDDLEEEEGNDQQTISGGSSNSSILSSGDLATFTVGIDSTALTESETIPNDDEDYVENNSFTNIIYITYSGSTATVNGSVEGVTITTDGAHVTVTSTAKGVAYILNGSSSDGSFKIQSSEKKFEIKLNGITLTNPNGAALNSQSGKRAYVVVADGTMNSLTDGTSYTIPDGEDMKGVIFSEGELLFSGKGNLRVYSKGKNGIVSDDYILIRPGSNIYVHSTSGNGIKANDAILIRGGVINVETSATAAKGISSDGYVQIDGGRTILLTTGNGEYDADEKDCSGAAGIKADSVFIMNDGELFCKSTGSGGKGISTDQDLTIHGGTIKVITTGKQYTYGSSDTSSKGIKSDGNVTIDGGSVMVRCTGGEGSEGIESKNILTIGGGSALSSGTYLTLADGDGNNIFAFKVPRAYNQYTLLFSNASMKKGSAYTLSSGATVKNGTNFDGYVTGATVSGGSKIASLTLSNMISTYNYSSGMGGGWGR